LSNIHYKNTNKAELREALKAVQELSYSIEKNKENFNLSTDIITKVSEMNEKIVSTLEEVEKILNIKQRIKEYIDYIESEIEKTPENPSFELDKVK
jgi:uncharacterized protein YaaR (DUF327 family)